MILVTLLVGFFLLLMALIDIKYKQVLSIIPTTAILLLVFYKFPFIYFGIAAFIFAWLLYEFDYVRGVADIKSIVIIGLTVVSLKQFYVFMILVASFGLIYQLVAAKILNIKNNQEIPFVPVFFIVYVVLQLLIYLW